MFYDERIENVKGRISRIAFLIALTVSFFLGGIHLANIIRNAPEGKFFWLVTLEVAVFIGALVVLAIGYANAFLHAQDERVLAVLNLFYNTSASLVFKTVLVIFAFVMPIALHIQNSFRSFADQGFGAFLYVLLFVLGIFIIYCFRRNDVFFNYSIIDSEHYYQRILKNIGKFALYAVVLFTISLISFAGVVAIELPNAEHTIGIFTDIIAFYLSALIEFALLYLLYSFLERSSYRRENAISTATLISLGITVFLYAVYATTVIVIDAQPIPQATAAWLVSMVSSFDIYIRFAFLIFLTYFGYEYQRAHKNKLLSAGCLTILLSETVCVLLGQIAGGLIFVFMPEIMKNETYVINQIFSTVQTCVEDASTVANIVGFVLIIFAIVNDRLIHAAHRYAIGAFAVLVGVEIFLRTQVDHLAVSIYHYIAEIAVLCYFAVLIVLAMKRNEEIQIEQASAEQEVQPH